MFFRMGSTLAANRLINGTSRRSSWSAKAIIPTLTFFRSHTRQRILDFLLACRYREQERSSGGKIRSTRRCDLEFQWDVGEDLMESAAKTIKLSRTFVC